MTDSPAETRPATNFRVRTDVPFFTGLGTLAGSYVLLIVALLVAAAAYTTPADIWEMLQDPDIQYSIRLSLLSCTVTTILSLWVAVPIGYLMSRHQFPGKVFLDAILDIPVVLPPLVVGIFLLILFQTAAGNVVENAYVAADGAVRDVLGRMIGRELRHLETITYEVPAVILAQFMVACAFAVRTMRVVYEQIDPRYEHVALTLGCSRGQAFWSVVFPQSRRGILAAGTLAWARSLGEFGPILVFAGATRGKTEVLSTTVFLEFSIGDIERAVAASMIMVSSAVVVLVIARVFGLKRMVM